MDSLSTQVEDKLLTTVDNLQETCPVDHNFSDGVYTRTVFMPAGMLIVGKAHKTRHLNVVMTGSCDVMIGNEMRYIKAPYTFESLEGSQKLLYIHEDCTWMTIHVNEDDERDLKKLEERYIDAEVLPSPFTQYMIEQIGGNK